METLNLSQIARRAGVTRAAVVNWRRRHPDFPGPVDGTAERPLVRAEEAEDWLRAHGKLPTGLTALSCLCGEPDRAPGPARPGPARHRRTAPHQCGRARRRHRPGSRPGTRVHPAEMSALEQKVIARGAELAARCDRENNNGE
ncbi:hypothetical protein GCM10015535_69180 [Streptomyces gelaticus]|uniref:Uncharacterized protein n=1 Tax=Streptomyces gelaticus TaxID=285446 RepID=A0ABQ2WBW1_9ACTN|nr:hypothetical protein GCM10015535_69180 [Streptomyces gelaticus]